MMSAEKALEALGAGHAAGNERAVKQGDGGDDGNHEAQAQNRQNGVNHRLERETQDEQRDEKDGDSRPKSTRDAVDGPQGVRVERSPRVAVNRPSRSRGLLGLITRSGARLHRRLLSQGTDRNRHLDRAQPILRDSDQACLLGL